MQVLEWNPDFSVSVSKFDDQHKKLIETINQLHAAMKVGEGIVILGAVLQSLIAYTDSHFVDEEKMMEANGYPDLAKHKADHDQLLNKVLELQSKFIEGNGTLSINVLTFLKDWLVNHIQGEDKRYGSFFNAKGIF